MFVIYAGNAAAVLCVLMHNDVSQTRVQCKLGIVNAIVVVTSQTHGEKDKRLSEPCIVNSDDATTLRI